MQMIPTFKALTERRQGGCSREDLQRTPWDHGLPGDILRSIFARLDHRDLVCCSGVNTFWRREAADAGLWQMLAEKRGLAGYPSGDHRRAVAVDINMRRGRPSRSERLRFGEELAPIALSADGSRFLVYEKGSKVARIYDKSSGQRIVTKAYPEALHTAALSPDGRFSVARGWCGPTWVNHNETGLDCATLRLCWPLHWVNGSDAFIDHPHGGQAVHCFLASTGRRLWTIAHDTQIRQMVVSPDQSKIAATDRTFTVRISETSGGQARGGVPHTDAIHQMLFSPDSRVLATASFDCTVQLTEAETGFKLGVIRHPRTVSEVLFSPDSRKIYTDCCDGHALLSDGATGTPLVEVNSSGSPGSSFYETRAFFSPDGDFLARYRANALFLTDVATGRTWKHRHDPPAAGLRDVVFSPDSMRMITMYDGSGSRAGIRIDRLRPVAESHFISGSNSRLMSWRLSPDSSKIATIWVDGQVRLFDGDTAEPLAPIRPQERGTRRGCWACTLHFTSDGSRLISLRNDAWTMFDFTPSSDRGHLLARLRRWAGGSSATSPGNGSRTDIAGFLWGR